MSKQKEWFEKWLEEKEINKKHELCIMEELRSPTISLGLEGDCIWALLRAPLSVVVENPKENTEWGGENIFL